VHGTQKFGTQVPESGHSASRQSLQVSGAGQLESGHSASRQSLQVSGAGQLESDHQSLLPFDLLALLVPSQLASVASVVVSGAGHLPFQMYSAIPSWTIIDMDSWRTRALSTASSSARSFAPLRSGLFESWAEAPVTAEMTAIAMSFIVVFDEMQL